MKMNKRGQSWLQILIWILAILFIAVIIWAISGYTAEMMKPENSCEARCTKECAKFDYKFYKIESCGIRWENCWCLDENGKPKSIGSLP